MQNNYHLYLWNRKSADSLNVDIVGELCSRGVLIDYASKIINDFDFETLLIVSNVSQQWRDLTRSKSLWNNAFSLGWT